MRGKWVSLIGLLFAVVALGGQGAQTQTLATRQVMHDKLAHAQQILEALMKSDGDRIAVETNSLSRLTQQPGWMVLTTPEYARYTTAFLNAVTDLGGAGRDRDFDGAAVHYTSMVLACYECHRYVARARLTEIDPIGDGDGDDQRPPARQPPARPSQPSTAVPRPPAPKPPPSARPVPPHPGAIYPYPPVFHPGFVYRFPYGVYPYYQWGYPYAPYWYPWPGYPVSPPYDLTVSPEQYGTVQLDVTPRTASVVVDGFYAGTVDDLDNGQLHLMPGPHHIELQLEGYQTGTFDVHVQANHSVKFQTTLAPSKEG